MEKYCFSNIADILTLLVTTERIFSFHLFLTVLGHLKCGTLYQIICDCQVTTVVRIAKSTRKVLYSRKIKHFLCQ